MRSPAAHAWAAAALVRALAATFLVAVSACSDATSASGSAPAKANALANANSQDISQVDEFRSFSLTIYGYNYTDTEIGSFEVNGRGGGNLAVSTLTSAGGSSVCCTALFTPLPQRKVIRIKWTRDGNRWCEQDVPFSGPVPVNARYLEVHF